MSEESSATEIQVIEKNPESSPGKSMISERNPTAEVISQAIQSQLEAMLLNSGAPRSTMIIETEPHVNPCKPFFLVNMASGMDHGHTH